VGRKRQNKGLNHYEAEGKRAIIIYLKKDSLVLLNYETISEFIYIEVYLVKKERKTENLPSQNQLESDRT
jgi:hypothetical protein